MRDKQKQRRGRKMGLLYLEDICSIIGLLILLFSLIFLTDRHRFGWVLLLLPALGVLMNTGIAVYARIRGRKLLCRLTGGLAAVQLVFLIWLRAGW